MSKLAALAGLARAARAHGHASGAVRGCGLWTAGAHVRVRLSALGSASAAVAGGSGGAMRPFHSVIAQIAQTAPARPFSRCSPRFAASSHHVLLVHRQPSAVVGFWRASAAGGGGRRGARHFSAGPRDPRLRSGRYQEEMRKKNRQLALYMGGLTLFTISFTYLSVPLYRIFCAKTGFAGTVKPQDQVEYEAKAKPVSGKRVLTVKFNADTSITMPWKFIPDQHEIKVLPGEAALAFFTAENKTRDDIIGVASYNIQPEGAALYFNKIQCFCFEEQMLKAREKIDMPVFFFIDPDFLTDKGMDHVDTITLSYTFFKSGEADAPEVAGMHVPLLPARDKQASTM